MRVVAQQWGVHPSSGGASQQWGCSPAVGVQPSSGVIDQLCAQQWWYSPIVGEQWWGSSPAVGMALMTTEEGLGLLSRAHRGIGNSVLWGKDSVANVMQMMGQIQYEAKHDTNRLSSNAGGKKTLVPVKSFWMHYGQKVVQLQTCNEHNASLEASICAASWDLSAALILDPHNMHLISSCPMTPMRSAQAQRSHRLQFARNCSVCTTYKAVLCYRNNDWIMGNNHIGSKKIFCHSSDVNINFVLFHCTVL